MERSFGLGPREFVAPALRKGLVELVPEYAGTALGFFSLGTVEPSSDATKRRGHSNWHSTDRGWPLSPSAPRRTPTRSSCHVTPPFATTCEH